jgi:cation diffusion facilitator family transporter
MSEAQRPGSPALHSHVFLGEAHEANEQRTWVVIGLCTVMMAAEILGGWVFGSIALIADGLHMSTHAGALLLAALAYTLARRHADDPRFTFGAGKFGDLAGFASAIVLAMIALLIGYEAAGRFVSPVPIHFAEAIAIAFVGLMVNAASVWLLSGATHSGHDHGHGHAHPHGGSDSDGAPTARHDHAARNRTAAPAATRDNNLRSAIVHVLADGAVSVMVILGLSLAWAFGWLWMDPLAGVIGAVVIASWSAALIRDSGAVLLDMNPDRRMADDLRQAIAAEGDAIADLHLWRLGPGHLGAIVSIVTPSGRSEADYRAKLADFPALSHLTIEVRRAA